MNKEYENIKNSGISGNELLVALTEFELKNIKHFNSKVDLGGFYLLSGDIQRAVDFFRRAEGVIPKNPRDEETLKAIAIMHGSLAQIYLIQSEYDKAMEYAKKAVFEESNKQYLFLQAHILTAQDKQDEALALFDELYHTQRDLMAADDIRAFMYLLATAKRFGDCAAMVDLYFENGPFFNGLGLFASGAYESSGQANKAILAAFLDYEFISGYTETDNRAFLENIDILEGQLMQKGPLAETAATIRLLRCLFDNSDLVYTRGHNAFFAEHYCVLKKKILSFSLSLSEFEQYLQLERYFTLFPVYYWHLWQAALVHYPDSLASYVPALQKIILLDKDGRYAQPAWEEMTKLMGYTAE